MMKNYRRSLFVLFFLCGVSACRLFVQTDIQQDGSGQLDTAIIYSAKEVDDFAQVPGNAGLSICDQHAESLPAETVFREERIGGETHCTTTQSFADLNELRQLYDRMGNVRVNQLNFQLGRLRFDVIVDLSAAEDRSGAGHAWHLTLPGEIVDHNAQEVDGRTLIWQVESGEIAKLHAEADAGLSPASFGPAGMLLLLAACVVLAFSIAVSLMLMRRRK